MTLVSFAAEATPDGTLVRWETVSEVDNAGFNLFRNTTANTVGDLLANVPSQAPGSTRASPTATTTETSRPARPTGIGWRTCL